MHCWANYLTFLCHNFLVCKMEMLIIVSISLVVARINIYKVPRIVLHRE